MKKNLNGYTFIEVMICVAIVGVVAALVMPRVLNTTGNSVNATSVARAVELIQNGMSNIMQEAQNQSDEEIAVANLASIQLKDLFDNNNEAYLTDGANLFSETMGFMGTEEADDYSINDIRNYTGGALGNGMLTNTHAYKFKKTTPVIIYQEVPQANIANAEDDEVITRIFIDANGSKNPNQTGRDIFLFGLTNNGVLVPAGSQAYNEFDNTVAVNGCNPNNAGEEQPGNGLACTARLMADKWTINYQ